MGSNDSIDYTDDSATTEAENLLAGLIVFIIAFISFLVNLAFGYLSYKSKKLHHALGSLYYSLVFCDCGGCLLFAFYTAPMTIM